VFLKTETADSPFTNSIPDGKLLKIPIAHGEGCYFADEPTLAAMEAGNQVLWRYVDAEGEMNERANPNGSVRAIAGVCNEARNVAGLMPQPERASDSILGSDDGLFIFKSRINALKNKPALAGA